MKHLITGGSGFIGNLTARRLRERGDGVRLLDIWADPSRPKDIAFINSSVLERDGVAAAMRDVDVVHHNAAIFAKTDAERLYLDVTVDGTLIVAMEVVKRREVHS